MTTALSTRDDAAAVLTTLVLGVMVGLCWQHAMWWSQATGRALMGLGRWVLRASHSPITPTPDDASGSLDPMRELHAPEDMGQATPESTAEDFGTEEPTDEYADGPGASCRLAVAVPRLWTERWAGDPARGIAAAVEEPSGSGTSCPLAAAVPHLQSSEPTGGAAEPTPEPQGSQAGQTQVVMVMVATQTEATLETGGAAPPAPAPLGRLRIPRRVWVTAKGGCYHLDDCPCIRNRIGMRTYSFCTRCG